MNALMHQNDVQVVAVCDVDQVKGTQPAKVRVEKHYSEKGIFSRICGCPGGAIHLES